MGGTVSSTNETRAYFQELGNSFVREVGGRFAMGIGHWSIVRRFSVFVLLATRR